MRDGGIIHEGKLFSLCAYCRQLFQLDEMTLDHVVPVSRGGVHAIKNKVLACKKCNSRKANKLASEYLAE